MFNRIMLSHAEISDRLEMQQLLIDYSTAIDRRRSDDLDRVFTPDAYIDYRAGKRPRDPEGTQMADLQMLLALMRPTSGRRLE